MHHSTRARRRVRVYIAIRRPQLESHEPLDSPHFLSPAEYKRPWKLSDQCAECAPDQAESETGWPEGLQGRLAVSPVGQCQLDPDCIRGFSHMGMGGRCSLKRTGVRRAQRRPGVEVYMTRKAIEYPINIARLLGIVRHLAGR